MMEITSIINTDFLEFQEDITLSQMLGKMQQFEKRAGLVFRNKKYLGLVGKKKLLRTSVDAAEMKIGNLIERTPIISEDADVIETAYLMFQSNVDFLPVERNKIIIGVVSDLELAKLASLLPEVAKLKVSDTKLITPARIDKDDSVAKAMAVMYKEHIDHVPIFDKGTVYGILSYRDLLRKYLNWSPKKDVSAKFNKMASSRAAQPDVTALSELPISSFSTNDNLISGQNNDTLKNATELMAKNRISDLIILQGGEYMGLLTVKNIMRNIGSLKVPQNFNIKFVGLNDVGLEAHEIANIQKAASNESFKLQRKIHNDFMLTIHLKEYEREGRQHKYSINLRVEFPGKIITSTQEDWDVVTAVRKAFNNAKNELGSRFKGDSGRKQMYE